MPGYDETRDNTGPQNRLFFKRMWKEGDTATTSMAVDGSVTPVKFILAPAAGNILRVARGLMYVTDAGTFDSGNWGNGITLANGQNFKATIDGVNGDLLGFPIKTTGDAASVCYDISRNGFGSGNEYLVGRFTFTKAGQYIRLIGDNNDQLEFIINDDMTALVAQYIMFQGYYENLIY